MEEEDGLSDLYQAGMGWDDMTAHTQSVSRAHSRLSISQLELFPGNRLSFEDTERYFNVLVNNFPSCLYFLAGTECG